MADFGCFHLGMSEDDLVVKLLSNALTMSTIRYTLLSILNRGDILCSQLTLFNLFDFKLPCNFICYVCE